MALEKQISFTFFFILNTSFYEKMDNSKFLKVQQRVILKNIFFMFLDFEAI